MLRLNRSSTAFFCFLCVVCLSSYTSAPHPANSPAWQADSALVRLESRVFQLVNQYRQSRGCMALELNEAMADVARKRSIWMADHETMSHDGFDWAAALKEVIAYESIAENLGTNFGYRDPAEAALEGWIKSDPHRRSMLDNFNLTGVGVVRDSVGVYYITQLFIRSR